MTRRPRPAAAAALTVLDDVVGDHAGTGQGDRYAGAVALITCRGDTVHERAYGHAQTHQGHQPLDRPRPMRSDTVFDVASITKAAATTAAVMRLIDQGRLSLDERLGDHLPRFRDDAKGEITLRQLLTHRAGLWEWQPTYLHARGAAQAIEFLAGLELRYPVGRARRYSDIGFMLLGAVVEAVTGQRLNTYVGAEIHRPLGMADTRYRPPASLCARVAATSLGNAHEQRMIATERPYPVVGGAGAFDGWRAHTLVGEANDANAWHGFDGVAGHAGLFATARDLAAYGHTLIDAAARGRGRPVRPATLAAFLEEPYDAGQALGFWSDRLSVVGEAGGFGHGGFTGTEFLFDPGRELVVVFLTNRLHPERDSPPPIDDVWHAVLRQVVEALADG